MERRTLARRTIVFVAGIETMVDSVASPALSDAKRIRTIGRHVCIVIGQIDCSTFEFSWSTRAVRFIGFIVTIIDAITSHGVINARTIRALEGRRRTQ